jgi:YtcA family
MIFIRRYIPKTAILFALAMLLTGCDPTINFYGTFIPAWLICMAAGAAGAVLLRYLFAALRLEPHLGPLILVYPCLVLLLSCVIWIFFFQS